MLIKNAELKGIFVKMDQLPQEKVAEIALVGRSNVGKSSLINRIVNRKNLARSSSTPGKTRTINFYWVNREWYLVDLPGYGYAKVSKAEKARWGKMIEDYLQKRSQLRGVIQVVDVRHSPSQEDVMMNEWLLHYHIPTLVVATKSDKISRGSRGKNLTVIKKTLQIEAGIEPICFSAQSGEGVEEVRTAIEDLLSSQTEG